MKYFWIVLFLVMIRVVYGQSEKIIKCGFAEQLRTGRYKTSLYKSSSFEHTYTSPSGHFIIYYNTTGDSAVPGDDFNQNGIPDRVEIAGQYGDKIWALLIDTLGFHPPYDYSGNLINQYSLYFVKFGYALYGQTVFASDDIPSVPGYNMASYIELNTDYSFADHLSSDPFIRDSLAIAVTVSHEFFHAVQLGYHVRFGSGGIDDDLWWIEASATAFEEWNVPDANDYLNYIPSLYRYLNYPVYQSIGQRIYGEVVIPLVMGNHWGREFMRIIWENIINQNAVLTIQNFLAGQGSSWKDILAEVGWWCVQAGKNLAEYSYPDLSLWPDFESITSINSINTQQTFNFKLNADNYTIQMAKLTSLQYPRYKLTKLSAAETSNILWSPLATFYSFSDQSIIFQSPADSLYYFLQAVEQNNVVDSVDYSLQPFFVNEQSISHYFPNPLNRATDDFLIVQKVPGLKEIELFSINGNRVFEYQVSNSDDYLFLPVKELASVKTGMYVIKITANQNIVGKLMIIQ